MKTILLLSLIALSLKTCSDEKPIKKLESKITENNFSIDSYPQTEFSKKILVPQKYHGDEITQEDINVPRWIGLFKNAYGYYVSESVVKFRRVKDAMLDDEYQETGVEVYTTNIDSAVVFYSYSPDNVEQTIFEPKKVAKANIPELIEPNKPVTFEYLGKKYTLSSYGEVNHEGSSAQNYTLTLTTIKKGKIITQLLLSQPSTAEIIFGGDLDKDGNLDLIINTSDHYNVFQPTLYLSSQVYDEGVILKIEAIRKVVGC